MPDLTRTLDLPHVGATDDLASELAAGLCPGDCVLLSGPMGAGKSHLARGVIQRLQARYGAVEDVPSPTYTLVQTYAAGPIEIVHADLYRLSAPEEIEELGLGEAFDTALCLVEWPERLGDSAPAAALRIALEMAGPGRHVRMTGPASRWAGRLRLGDREDA